MTGRLYLIIMIPALLVASAADDANPIDRLQRKIDSGEVTLQFDAKNGYLKSLLEALEIPVESQMLVFSKTSLQRDRISPQTPRALYFNDEVYIGWVQGGRVIEMSSTDAVSGAAFYALAQNKDAPVRFERRTMECLQCHGSVLLTDGAPGHIMRSVVTDRKGGPLFSAGNYVTTDRSPMEERWGGWYVTGRLGRLAHMGNLVLKQAAGETGIDLTRHLDTSPYLSNYSDLAAMMVLAHQIRVHNLIGRANTVVRMVLEHAEKPDSDVVLNRIKSVADPIVSAMLFTDEQQLAEPISGTSGFAEEFAGRGPIDKQGRSLRQFDLKQRLFKYPLSYLIYSEGFDALPLPAKEYIYGRLREVLRTQSGSDPFRHLTNADRAAILEILQDTKPDFAAMRR